MNGLVGRRVVVVVVVVVVDLGSDIYLCSECRMSWVNRTEAREKELDFEAQWDCIMSTCAWDEWAAFALCIIVRRLKFFRRGTRGRTLFG